MSEKQEEEDDLYTGVSVIEADLGGFYFPEATGWSAYGDDPYHVEIYNGERRIATFNRAVIMYFGDRFPDG